MDLDQDISSRFGGRAIFKLLKFHLRRPKGSKVTLRDLMKLEPSDPTGGTEAESVAALLLAEHHLGFEKHGPLELREVECYMCGGKGRWSAAPEHPERFPEKPCDRCEATGRCTEAVLVVSKLRRALFLDEAGLRLVKKGLEMLSDENTKSIISKIETLL